ncbi:shikimate dehydrogenase [Herbivorax sp. ANBcel31]|uniref:shikimate dehydrogenase n=1 Tax=Herbivorax sp. ANBcel31 TaxID=3069754 RepID=UPI0027B743A2|nr:shikimate dehydrogenase [Herbivorax sp. ANBcel31]MDQ2086814.1 shikimate dehydrogenase [Herbivorax sp. ANBcel31]
MNIDDRVTGQTKLIGLIGNPVEHSISPMLHNSLSSLLGLDLVYVPLKVEKEDLHTVVKALKALDFVGFNVTIPYKKEIMKYIDDNTIEAILMGAVNTVKKIDGRLWGYNTDAEGFLRSFKEEAKTSFKGKKVVLIGAGGVARPVAVKIASEGAEKISIVNRTKEKAIDLAEVVNENVNEVVQVYNFEDKTFKMAFEESDIIINTTSVGMTPDVEETPVSGDYFNENQIVYDVIYNPVETKLLSDAKNKGCKTINGLGMLFYQGIKAYEIWTGVKLSDEDIKNIYGSFKEILDSN